MYFPKYQRSLYAGIRSDTSLAGSSSFANVGCSALYVAGSSSGLSGPGDIVMSSASSWWLGSWVHCWGRECNGHSWWLHLRHRRLWRRFPMQTIRRGRVRLSYNEAWSARCHPPFLEPFSPPSRALDEYMFTFFENRFFYRSVGVAFVFSVCISLLPVLWI